MATKKQVFLEKVAGVFCRVLLLTAVWTGLEADQEAKNALEQIVVDQNNKKIPSGYAKLKGETKLSSIDLTENSKTNFSKKLVLKFAKLKGFQSSSKQVKNGKMIHELVFDGLDEGGFDLGRLRQGLAKMAMQETQLPAFERFSIKPIGRKTGDRSYIPQLRLLIETNPERVFVKVGQEDGTREVGIEVFDKKRLQKAASQNSSHLKYALGGDFEGADNQKALIVFAEKKKPFSYESHRESSFVTKVYDDVFDTAKLTFDKAGIGTRRAFCRTQSPDQQNFWLAGGIGADLTVCVQLGVSKDGSPSLKLLSNQSKESVELAVSFYESKTGKKQKTLEKDRLQEFFKALVPTA